MNNQWRSRKFLIPKQFIRGHDVNVNIHKRFPQAAGCRSQAAGCKLKATGSRRGATGPLGASGYKPKGYKHHVWGLLPGSFQYVDGLSESGDFQLHIMHRCCELRLFFKICGIGNSQWCWPEVLFMLWEGEWEWARLTKSKYISIEITCPSPPPPPYLLLISILLPLPVNWPTIGRFLPPCRFRSQK